MRSSFTTVGEKILVQPADDRGGVRACEFEDRQVGERVAGLEQDRARVAVLVAPAEEERVLGVSLVVDPQVGALALARLGHELLVDGRSRSRACPAFGSG